MTGRDADKGKTVFSVVCPVSLVEIDVWPYEGSARSIIEWGLRDETFFNLRAGGVFRIGAGYRLG
ncbi:hypothetical protein [Rhizobium fabae]|uniref:Uncharacterized protein n=1 Tax=Rhizobium fabae TaxID=573179 RepID=A0A7W6FHP5_9HYPH|nr:hypothetical protein [Rhizobium fabae]MBB3914120.1 hypothetical protein [Rhizobium fabae]